MDSSPTSTMGCFGCFRKVNQRTARSYISSGYYGTNGFKYLAVNGQPANGVITAGPRPHSVETARFKSSPPLTETGASSPQYVSIDQASEMSRRAIVDRKRSILYVQRSSDTNDSGIGRCSGRELSDESFSRHQLTYANVHKQKPLYPSILHPALQEQLSLSASSSPGGCRVPRRASASQIAPPRGTPQRSCSQRFDPKAPNPQPPIPIHRDHVRRSSYLSNESSETGSEENNADSTLAREMALLKLELEMVRLECESIMRQQARANSYSHLNKHCNGKCCYHQHSGYYDHIYDDVHTYSRGPRAAYSHNYVNVPYAAPFQGHGQGLPAHPTRFNGTPIDVLRLRQRSSSASPSRFGRGVSESHSMMDMPRRVTSPSPSPLVNGHIAHNGIQQVASHASPIGQSYLYRPHRSCSNPAIKRLEEREPPIPPREQPNHNGGYGGIQNVAYPYKHSRSRSHGGGFQQYQSHFQQSIPTVQEQSGSSREQLDDMSSDESRSVTPVAEYEHSLPSTPGTQSPCPASEPIAGPHARRPMGGLGPPTGGTPQHRVAVTFREQQPAHYNSPASNCNSPRYSRERTVEEANESMHHMMHLLANLDKTRRMQTRLQMQETLPQDPHWPINPNLNPELHRDREKLKEKIKRKRERAQKRREQPYQNPVSTDTMSTTESEYGFLPGRRPASVSKHEFGPPGEIRSRNQPQPQDHAENDDSGSRCTTPRNEEPDESGLVSPSLLPSPGSGLSSPVSSGNGNSLPTAQNVSALLISSSANASPTQTIFGNNNGSGGLPTKDIKEVKDIRDIKDILREKNLVRSADKSRIDQIKKEESDGTVSTTL